MNLKEAIEYINTLTGGVEFSLKNGFELDYMKTENFKPVYHFGGEGKGEHMENVWEVTKPDGSVFHISMSGYYSSWNESEWTNISLVAPEKAWRIEYKQVEEV